ncbi:DUF4236 domain-containing protein [Alcaligenes aquatilis]
MLYISIRFSAFQSLFLKNHKLLKLLKSVEGVVAVRFRRSIKLAPGIRMNLSGSGMSWTLGPRGSTVNVGKRGAHLNTSFLGFSARHSLYKAAPAPKPRQSVKQVQTFSLVCEVTDQGMLTFHDQDGEPVSESLVELAKKQNRQAIQSLIQRKCDEINSECEAVASIHLDTPAPDIAPKYVPDMFHVPEPIAPVLPRAKWWEKLFPRRVEQLNLRNQQRVMEHQGLLAAWKSEQSQHAYEQEQRRKLLEQDIYHDTAAMEQWLEATLQDIAWPRETLISLEISEQGARVCLDVDLPEIEDMPSKIAAVPARGLKLSVKDLPMVQARKRYMAHVHGVGFRIIGETFAALPVVQRITLSGFSQRHDPATGQLRDDYLYSVNVSREAWAGINFEMLPMIDVVEALAQFDLRRNMSKTGVFKPIEPF